MKANNRLLKMLVGVTFLVPAVAFSEEPDVSLFHARSHVLEGLPSRAGPQAIYDENPGSFWNRLHHLLFVAELIPEEIQAELPQERERLRRDYAATYTKQWYFEKRKGESKDKKVFGGDIRVSPRKSFSGPEREALFELLSQVPEEVERFRASDSPYSLLLKQWDLLSVWWALEREKCPDEELLQVFCKAIVATSQPRKTLANLESGIEDIRLLKTTDSTAITRQPYLPDDLQLDSASNNPWIEIERKSSALFRANRSLRSTRVFVHAGSRVASESLLASVQSNPIASVKVPEDTKTLLVQQLVTIDENLEPIATPVIDELRVRAIVGPAELSPTSQTSSRDGSSHWIYQRTRYGTVRDDFNDFRFVPDTNQALFLEYGTLKHATFAAQCALCHRRTDSGGQAPEGIRSFSKYATARIASPGERNALAESEMREVVTTLKQRLGQATEKPTAPAVETAAGDTEPVPPTAKLKPRPVRSESERKEWVAQLRRLYASPPEQWPAPNVDPGVAWREIGLLPKVEHPATNPYNPDKEKLGKILFFDPRLSGSKQIACASCHDPDLGWADGRTTSFGHGRTPLQRNAPTIRNSAFHSTLFWDGRAKSLEEQVVAVLRNPNEMRATEQTVLDLLSRSDVYQVFFQQSFGDGAITIERVAEAIACFERTIVGGSSRFDVFMKGNRDVLSDDELIGLDLYRREARCMNCHHGPLFSDGKFHDVGLSYYGRKFEDLARYRITNDPQDVGRFRTPSLRDITQTTPLMHNGLFELPGVLNMYNAGMPTLRPKVSQVDDPRFPRKSEHLKPLGLNKQDLEDLGSFLKSLEEPKRRMFPPPLPDSHEIAAESSSR